jgi:hypothetical protein
VLFDNQIVRQELLLRLIKSVWLLHIVEDVKLFVWQAIWNSWLVEELKSALLQSVDALFVVATNIHFVELTVLANEY